MSEPQPAPAPPPPDPLAHWQGVYSAKPDDQLSWFQPAPQRSIALLTSPPLPASIIDVGGGQSSLAAALLEAGIPSVTVLDISAAALERAKARVGPAAAARIRWIAADIRSAPPLDPVDAWHDRAVLHFLTDPADRTRYIDLAARTVRPGGRAVIAGFAPEGPERCSGLPVARRDAAAIAAEFAPRFRLVHAESESHTTPWGKPQAFAYAVLQRNP